MIHGEEEKDNFIEQIFDSGKWELISYDFPNPSFDQYKFYFKQIKKIVLVVDYYPKNDFGLVTLYGLTNKKYFIDDINKIDEIVIKTVKDEALRLSRMANSLIEKSTKYIDTLELIYNKK